MCSLPTEADQTISRAFPDALDLDCVRHSDECYTIVLMDVDYKHYTFRLNLSLDGRWSLAPISGFSYGDPSEPYEGWIEWESQSRGQKAQ